MNLKQTEQVILTKAKWYQEIQSVCSELLLTHPLALSARQYLEQRISPENQKDFDLGYFPDDQHLNILSEKISEKKLNKLGLIYPYHVQNGDYRVYLNKGFLSNHNLTMSYRDVYGNITALVGRSLLPELDRKSQQLQKYKNTKFNKSLHLFGLYQAKPSIVVNNSVVLVEGQFDCITCRQFGIYNVVALGGCALTKRQFQLLTRFTDHFYLLLDNDLEGKKARDKIVKRYGIKVKIEELNLPELYKDVDEYLRSSHKIKCTFETFRENHARS